ncbi:sensor domain-containing diguanylate cyclase [Curvibacter lanceolatus]|uniref:sensor domain-containing diguanylate cyclase n=1 Tax=Curvibacter lanceolatus TaxID=86182 RepID=UPI00035DD182|nr:GGDEF domain-containing protein [Curvibacter lanceolatus]
MAFRRFANSLATRLIVISIATVALGLVMRMTLLPLVVRGSLEDVVMGQQATLANYVADDIDAKVRARRALLERLAIELPPALLGQPEALQAWLAERQMLAPLFSHGFIVIRPDGRGAWADFPPRPRQRSSAFHDTDWFRRLVQQPGFVLARPRLSEASGAAELLMAVPVQDPRGRLQAVLAGVTELDAPGFLDLLQRPRSDKGADFLLISPAEQMFVAASVPELRLQRTPTAGVNPLHDRAMAGWRGAGVSTNARGGEEIVGVASVPSAGWFVVAGIPADVAFEAMGAVQKLALRSSLVIASVVLVALAFVLRRQFQPLIDSARRMHRMADRLEPLAPLPVVRQDEVGEMVVGFNTLLEKLQESERRMEHLAHHDALTGLPNRRSLMDRLTQLLALAQRQDRRLAVMFFDLDGFKPVNDHLGHEMGDRLLQAIATRLRSGVRQADVVARIGGDEFVLVMFDVASREVAAELARKLIDQLAQPYLLGEQEIRISASAGLALYPEHARDRDQLLARADTAMYAAKRAGTNQIRFAGV